MLRQMEYDADGYETQLAGSEVFEGTTRLKRVTGAKVESLLSVLRIP